MLQAPDSAPILVLLQVAITRGRFHTNRSFQNAAAATTPQPALQNQLFLDAQWTRQCLDLLSLVYRVLLAQQQLGMLGCGSEVVAPHCSKVQALPGRMQLPTLG